MKLALISDIHGNYEALKSVIDAIDNIGVDKIYCLGDVVGYYSRINECCELLRNRGIETIMGNHDWYLISGSGCPRSKTANECIAFHREIITKDNFEWISKFKICHKLDKFIMFHGGFENPIDEYMKPEENLFKNNNNSYFASGHSHMQMIKEFGGKLYCNPGSVGQPRDGDNRAAFATFNGTEFSLHRVEYDIDKTCKEMSSLGFNGYYFERLRYGSRHFHN